MPRSLSVTIVLLLIVTAERSVCQDSDCFDPNVAFPEDSINASYTRLLNGDFIFTDLVFNCTGTIKAITVAVKFPSGYKYTSSLSMNLTVWRIDGPRIVRMFDRDHLVSITLNTTYFHLSQNVDGTFSSLSSTGSIRSVSFGQLNIDVDEGNIFGMSLPSSTTTMVSGITVGVDIAHVSSPIIAEGSTRDCWSTDGTVGGCNSVLAYGRPFVRLQIDPRQVVTSGTDSQAQQSAESAAAVAFAVIFGVMLVVAVAVISVLAVLLVKARRQQPNRRYHVDKVVRREITPPPDYPGEGNTTIEPYLTMTSAGSVEVLGTIGAYSEPRPLAQPTEHYEYASLSTSYKGQGAASHQVVPTGHYDSTTGPVVDQAYNRIVREPHNNMEDNQYVTPAGLPPAGNYNTVKGNTMQYSNSVAAANHDQNHYSNS